MSQTYDVDSYDYEVGRIHKGMQVANHFQGRNINIVENGQGQIRVSQTVNAWNEDWDKLDDAGIERVNQTTYVLENDERIVTSTGVVDTDRFRFNEYIVDNVEVSPSIGFEDEVQGVNDDLGYATYINADGVETTSIIRERDTQYISDNNQVVEISANVENGWPGINDFGYFYPTGISYTTIRSNNSIGASFWICEDMSFVEIIDEVETGVRRFYDTGFEDGYAAGFAAAKGVVKS